MPRKNGAWTCSYTKVLSSPSFTTLISYGSYDIHDNIASFKKLWLFGQSVLCQFFSSLALRLISVSTILTTLTHRNYWRVFTACRLSNLFFYRRGVTRMSKHLIADRFPQSLWLSSHLVWSCIILHGTKKTVSTFKDTGLITCTARSNIKKISTFAHMCKYVLHIRVRLNGD